MLQSIMGYGYPPRCEQTNKVKLLPSRRTTYAGGNEELASYRRNMLPPVTLVVHCEEIVVLVTCTFLDFSVFAFNLKIFYTILSDSHK